MDQQNTELQRITITLTDREDGGLHIHSEDVPGLHLSGPTPESVWGRLPSAVKALLQANKGLHVLEVYLPSLESAPASVSPRDVPMHVRCATVVVELNLAA